MKLSQKLVQARVESSLTQKQLGDLVKLSASVIGNIESGLRVPSKNAAYKLSKYFKTDMTYWINVDETIEYVAKRNKYEMLESMIESLKDRGFIVKGIISEEGLSFIKQALEIDLQFMEVNKRRLLDETKV